MNQIDFINDTVITLFNYYDEDKSGALSREEIEMLLGDICTDLALPKLDEGQLKKMFMLMDENNDDEITLPELTENLEIVKSMLKQKNKAKTIAMARQVFHMFKLEDQDTLHREQLKE